MTVQNQHKQILQQKMLWSRLKLASVKIEIEVEDELGKTRCIYLVKFCFVFLWPRIILFGWLEKVKLQLTQLPTKLKLKLSLATITSSVACMIEISVHVIFCSDVQH